MYFFKKKIGKHPPPILIYKFFYTCQGLNLGLIGPKPQSPPSLTNWASPNWLSRNCTCFCDMQSPQIDNILIFVYITFHLGIIYVRTTICLLMVKSYPFSLSCVESLNFDRSSSILTCSDVLAGVFLKKPFLLDYRGSEFKWELQGLFKMRVCWHLRYGQTSETIRTQRRSVTMSKNLRIFANSFSTY